MMSPLSAARTWFRKFIDPDESTSKDNLFYLFIAAAAVILLSFIISFVVTILLSDAGSFGDLFGGTVNPILTFLTFMGLLVTIVLQQTELRESRVELNRSATALESQLKAIDRQNFDSTFFEMLTLHNTIVNSIDLKFSERSSGQEQKGRDCFRTFLANFQDEYSKCPYIDERDRLQFAYDKFWERRQQDLAHYYRYLYNVLRFVHESRMIESKHQYIKLLRAQLSDYELLLLFYTALNRHGINYWKYIHEYMLFDNLRPELLIIPKHKELYSLKSFGEPKHPAPDRWPPARLAEEYERKANAKLSDG